MGEPEAERMAMSDLNSYYSNKKSTESKIKVNHIYIPYRHTETLKKQLKGLIRALHLRGVVKR